MSNNVHHHVWAALAGFAPPVAPAVPAAPAFRYVEVVEPREPADVIPTLGEREIAEYQRQCRAEFRSIAQRRRIADLADAVPHRFPDLKVVK